MEAYHHIDAIDRPFFLCVLGNLIAHLVLTQFRSIDVPDLRPDVYRVLPSFFCYLSRDDNVLEAPKVWSTRLAGRRVGVARRHSLWPAAAAASGRHWHRSLSKLHSSGVGAALAGATIRNGVAMVTFNQVSSPSAQLQSRIGGTKNGLG